MRGLALVFATSLLITSPAFAKRDAAPPPATETGKPVSCISLSQIRESKVRNDQVIDFRTSGKKWYRNTLPNSCPSLGLWQLRAFAALPRT